MSTLNPPPGTTAGLSQQAEDDSVSWGKLLRERLQSEVELRDRAIRAATQGIVITDPTRQDNPITYLSPGFELLTGYSESEVRGRNCRFLQGPNSEQRVVAQLREAIGAGRTFLGDLLNYRKDGTTFWSEVSITPVLDSAGRLIQFVWVLTDVTSRRNLEAQLRQAQKMEAVGQLAGGVAHDFNNLLTVINGFSAVALAEAAPGHPLWEPLLAIREAGERAAALTKQLLTFSRKPTAPEQVADLNQIVGSISGLIQRLIGKEHTLQVDLCRDPVFVRIDPNQMEQVLMNLAVNAKDAMPRGGAINVTTATVGVATPSADCPSGNYVRVSIIDSGTGMSEEVKARIFEPFFTTKGEGKGTGLGLAVVFGIVHHFGGVIRVESSLGVGTTFNVFLPAVEHTPEVRTTSGAAELELRGSETVLLAEDEDGVRAFARIVLEMHGYTVLEAGSGEEALAVARGHPGAIDLLVTDMVMHDMGGRKLADAVQSCQPAARVLYVSGYPEEELARDGVAATAFLQKPFTPLTLGRKVREVLTS